MAAKNLSEIRQIVRQLLKDEFDPDVTGDWENDELDMHAQVCVDEISGKSPVKAWEPVIVTANSKLLDISGIENLIKADRVEYEPGGDPRNFHNIIEIDNETVEMGVSGAPSESGTSGTLTGTVTFAAGSAAVSGSGTAFSSELEAGDYIKPSTKGRWYRIYSVDSDTALTLDEPVKSADAGADTVSVTQYRSGCAVIYYDKAHELTETKSTLRLNEENAVILGVCGQAAVSRAKYLINRVNDGGANAAGQMQNWGVIKLQMYRDALRGLKRVQTKQSYAE
jgi:hypothetical protein